MRALPILGGLVSGVLLATTAGSATASDNAFRRSVFARGFDSPVHVVSTRSEPLRVYVVEQRGTIRVIEKGRVRSGFVLDLRGRVSRANEQGLLGLAFDPAYGTNRFFYINYTDLAGDTRVVRYRTNGRRALPASRRELLRVDQPASNHNGGNLAFGLDGFLYVGLGDGGGGNGGTSQDLDTQLGKMLRLNVRRPGSAPEVVAVGLRNPWRYSFDRGTGDLYIGDVGAGEVEEVDFTPAGSAGLENYGWNLYEGSRRNEQGDIVSGRLVFPIFEYGRDAGCTVIGGFVYRGKARPVERGRYLFGDYCSGTVWTLRVVAGAARGLRSEPFRIPELTSFGEDADGEIYAASRNGTIFRLS